MHVASETEASGPNPPGAVRMAIIAFVSFNLSLGCMFGPFSVLIDAIEQKLHVTRELSTLPIPVVTFGMSLLAPFAGALVSKYSLRLLMMAGSLMMAAGFAILAVTTSLPLFVVAYGLLIGPALSLMGMVAPSTLITRWFRNNRGRALGIAATPALMAVLPLGVAFILARSDLTTVYWAFVGVMLVSLVASALVIDFPADAQPATAASSEHGAAVPRPGMATRALLRDSRFWRLAVAAGLYNAVIVMFSTSIVPFATGLKIDQTSAAGLLTIYLIGTLVGTPLVGWTADKVGGTRMVAIACVLLAMWQGLLVTHPGFMGIAALAGLSGLLGSAMPPSLGLALSQQFGTSTFARALGISGLVGLPFAVAGVPLASAMFVNTGSYDGAFIMAATILAIGALLTLTLRQGPVAKPA